MIVTTQSESETERVGRQLAPLLHKGDCVTFTGELGVGKTTFIRALIRARAGEAIDVPSPTYGLIEAYEFETPIFHVDLYRLEGADEAVELGLDDLFDAGIVLMEWPDRAHDFLPAHRLGVVIRQGKGNERMIELTARGDGWQERLDQLAAQGSAP